MLYGIIQRTAIICGSILLLLTFLILRMVILDISNVHFVPPLAIKRFLMPEESKAIIKKETNKELFARLKKDFKPQECESVEDLPRWVKTALVFKTLDGMSFAMAAKRVGRNNSTLSKYAQSPAAKKWLESLIEFIEDPVEMAKAYLRGNALSITLERMAFLEAAIAAGDYKAGDAIAKDIQEKLGIVSPKTKTDSPPILNITIGAGSIEIPAIEAEWSEVKDEGDE